MEYVSVSWCAVLVIVLALTHVSCDIFYAQPEQIHLSYGRKPSSMIVTWTTLNLTRTPTVKYGTSLPSQQAIGNSTRFVDGGSQHRAQYIHRVIITGLKPGQKYYYYCGSIDGWSSEFWFTTMKDGTKWSPRLVMFGDLGNLNAQSLPCLQQEVEADMYDAVLHIGDFAYDMDTDSGLVGDAFMRQIESIAGYLPYMTSPGNHENAYNFSHYKNRFTMPTDEQSERMYYSFDIGPAHIISFSTEYYFFLKYGFWQIQHQRDWLEQDLKTANLLENRARRPWIITMAHRPMYCSTLDKDDCTTQYSVVRQNLEPLLDKYGVDVALWAHEHIYERLWPVFNNTVYNGSYSEPYTNPKAPVHVITGSAGCKERHDSFTPHPKPWSSVRNGDYGYTRMTIHNSTHISFQQVSDDLNGKIVDSFTVIKESHLPYGLSHPSYRVTGH